MKHLFIILSLAVTVALGVAAVRNTCALSWDYPASELPGMSFNVYFNTNLQTSTWVLMTNVSTMNVTVPILPGNGFWFVTASNQFGESDPSNVVTSTVARNVNGLKVK